MRCNESFKSHQVKDFKKLIMNIPPFVALEVGTKRTVVLVGEVNDSGQMVVIGRGEHISSGVKKGRIVDFDYAVIGVQEALKAATENSGVDIGAVFIAANGDFVNVISRLGSTKIHNHTVSQDDIDDVNAVAMDCELPQNTTVMHSLARNYRIDDQHGVVKPIGLKGSVLSLELLLVTANEGPIENFRNVANAASVDVEDFVFSPLAAAQAVLTPQLKRAGVAVIDLGAGTTNYIAYVDGVPASIGSLAVGGNYVTSDIMHAFNVPENSAEELKLNHGKAIVDGGGPRIPLPRSFVMRDRTIGLKSLRTVINARMDETLRIIKSKFVRDDVLVRLGAGIVFTGGAAAMPGLVELGNAIFGVPCTVGNKLNVIGLENVENAQSYAVPAGLLIYGYKQWEQNYSHDSNSGFKKILGRLFRR